MERTRYFDRDKFTYDEKSSIAKKSHDRCCHCGKLKYIGYGATIDHFIPISKGGMNQHLNLIMLCEDCNKEKDDQIVGLEYIPYLDDKYKDELQKYLMSYISIYDFLNRNRLVALDTFTTQVPNMGFMQSNRRLNKKNTIIPKIKYKIKLARNKDFERLCDYFEKYLKKYNRFISREIIEQQISFWLTFGSIYYFEKNNDIQMMLVSTIQHVLDYTRKFNVSYVLYMYVFSYYCNDNAISLAYYSIVDFCDIISNEQKFKFMPITVNMLDNDKIRPYLFSTFSQQTPDYRYDSSYTYVNNYIRSINIFIYQDKYNLDDITEEDVDKYNKFFSKFDNVINQLTDFFVDYDYSEINWLIYDILDPIQIKNSNLFENDKEFIEFNDKLLEDYNFANSLHNN